ncbi:hypothetical protein [Halovenus marina]|uniref:hypothetical protein n=1 Tax=Halovenus marina TaxID=3396621 RepID=UPI003F550A07
MEIDTDSLTTGQKVAAGAGIVTAIGAVLPWVDAGIVTVSGLDGDGVLTIIFGLVVLGLVLVREWGTVEMAATVVLGLMTTLIAGNVYGNLEDQAAQQILEAQAGIGLHLTLLGGLAMLGAGVYGYLKERNTSTRQAQAPRAR